MLKRINLLESIKLGFLLLGLSLIIATLSAQMFHDGELYQSRRVTLDDMNRILFFLYFTFILIYGA